MTAPTRTDSRQTVLVTRTPAAVIVLCGLTMIFEGYDIYVYGVTVPGILAHPAWNVSPAFVGVIGSAGVLGMLVGAVLVGLLTDRFGRKAMFLSTVVVFSLGMALCTFAPDPTLFLVGRVIVGIGSGGFMPTSLSLVVEFSPRLRRNLNVSLALAGVAVGGAAAAFLGIWVMPTLGYTAMYAVGIVPILLLPLLALRLPESITYLTMRGRIEEAWSVIDKYRLPVVLEANQGSNSAHEIASPRRAFAALFRHPYLTATAVFWLGTAFCMLLMFGANTWLPTLMLDAGYGLQSSLVFLVALNIGAVVGSIIASWFADRIGPKPLIIIGFLASSLALIGLSFRPAAAVVFALVLLVGFGAAGTQNLINSYATIYYPPSLRGTGVGMALAFGRIGGILGPIYGGLLVSGGATTQMSFFAFVVPAVLALVTMLFGPRVSATLPEVAH